MDSHRPRVALYISPRLFRDVLARALDPHVEVIVAPETEQDFASWAADQGPFDLAIVSGGGARVIDVDAGLVVEVPFAQGGQPMGTVRGGDGRTIRSLTELLDLLPTVA